MKRNPEFWKGYYANEEVVNADGQVVCVCDASVRQQLTPQEEHPERFDGTESAAAWQPLKEASHGTG